MSAKYHRVQRIIIVIIIALIVLGYFGFDLSEILNSPTVKSNLHTAWNIVLNIWNNYLAAPVIFIWDMLWKVIRMALPASNV